MSAKQPGSNGPGQNGLRLATSLRDQVFSGVIVSDLSKQTATLNAAAAQMLAFTGETTNVSLALLPAPLASAAREAFASGETAAPRRVNLSIPGRGPVTIQVNAISLAAKDRDTAVVLVLHDWTALKHSEQRLQQLNRLADLGLLAAGMAHEVKNALVAGKTFLDLLLEKNRDAELVEVVRREMNRIEGLVGGMLRFSRPAKTEFKEVHLHEVLEHSLRLVHGQREGKGIALDCSFRATTDQLKGDELQLEQAFLNLMVNALQAMGPNGKLAVVTGWLAPGAEPHGRHGSGDIPRLRVDIQDTGEGITPENLPHLFQPFFTTRPSGTGLGLAIAQRIIHEHRGAITVQSAPGKGTTFSILLPAA